MPGPLANLLRSKKVLFVVTISVIIALSYSALLNYDQFDDLSPNHHTDGKRRGWSIPCNIESESDRIVANGTLGFGAIYALGLSDRSDKRDAIELAASLTNLQVTWADGVLGAQMNVKAVPPIHFDQGTGDMKNDGEIGCWRGHMNILRKVVRSGVSSALILEDDADWDLHIVQQMQQFANASTEFLQTTPAWKRKPLPKTDSPYGEGWDVLWVGHCSGWAAFDPEEAKHIAIIRNDTTVPPAWDIVSQLREFQFNPSRPPCSAHLGADPPGVVCNSPRLAPNERIVQQRTSPLCTTGYAVSQQGARKMLARMGAVSVSDVQAPIDWEMINMCREELRPGVEAARCLTVSPPYIASHRSRGPKSLDSDIQQTGGHKEVRDVSTTKGMVWSTRMNIVNLIGGFEPESQYVQKEDGTFRYRKKTEYRQFQ